MKVFHSFPIGRPNFSVMFETIRFSYWKYWIWKLSVEALVHLPKWNWISLANFSMLRYIVDSVQYISIMNTDWLITQWIYISGKSAIKANIPVTLCGGLCSYFVFRDEFKRFSRGYISVDITSSTSVARCIFLLVKRLL